jgi:hypothetical protein
MWILWTPVAIICIFMYPCKWNSASSEKNDNCGLISPSATDCRNQLQKWTLLAGSHGCEAWITVVSWSLSNSVAILALDVDTPASCARRFSDFLGICSNLAHVSSNFSSVSTGHLCFLFCLLRVPLYQVYSPNYALFVCWELFHHKIYIKIFVDTF